MAEQLPDREDGEHPIVTGLVALVGVGVAVGLVIGLVVLVGTKVVGLGGGSNDAGSGQATLYIPTPVKTSAASGPQMTLSPQGTATSSAPASEPPSTSATPDQGITLAASTTQVGPMEQFQLTGVYPNGEGAILTVQRFEGGQWADFPATGSVSGGTFQIPVQTSRSGVNRFRVVDTDAHLDSDEVRITVTG